MRGRHPNTHKGLDRSTTCIARVKITFGTLSGKYDLQRLICTWEWSNRWEGVREGDRDTS